MLNWQKVIKSWIITNLGEVNFTSTEERCRRHLEECMELVQACGLSESDALKVVKYVYSRPVGNVHQEIGGTITTLLALAENQNDNVLQALIDESTRIHTPEIVKKARESVKRKSRDGVGL